MKLGKAFVTVISRIGLAVFGVALALAALELFLRAAYPTRIPTVPDPLLTYRLEPGVTAWRSFPFEYRTRYTLDTNGLREDGLPVDKPAGELRILVLGDSVALGLQVQPDETTPGQLEAALNAGGAARVEAINAAAPSYTTAQQALYAESEGLRFSPDVLVVIFYTQNDIYDNAYYDHVDWDTPGPIAAEDVRGLEVLEARTVDPQGNLRYASVATFWLAEMLRGQPAVVRLFYDTSSYVPLNYGIYAPEPPEWIKTGWQVTRAALARLSRIGAEAGAPLVVVVWPDPIEYDDTRWDTLIRTFPLMETYRRDQPAEQAAALLEELGIPHLSLLPVLRQAWQADPRAGALTFPRDTHPTAAAHSLAAQAIARYLCDQSLIPLDRCPPQDGG